MPDIEDVDEEIYNEQQNSEELLKTCKSPKIGYLIVNLAKEVLDALQLGIKIFIDIEPIQYESVLSLLSNATACAQFWRIPISSNEETEEKDEEKKKKYYYLSLSIFNVIAPKDDEIGVMITPNKKIDEINRDLEMVYTTQRSIYLIVTPQRPEISFTSAIYKENLVLNLVDKTLDDLYGLEHNKEYLEKKKYLGRLPHPFLLFSPIDAIKEAVKKWQPPPPNNADYLKKKSRGLNELILPKGFNAIIYNYLKVVEYKKNGSMLFIGLQGSGRKTLAKAIADELNYPAYIISLSNILGKYVGESESKLLSFFSSLRARGGLVVFDGVESLFKKSGSEEVQANLRNILMNEMSRDDNNFLVIFTSREDAGADLIENPILGEVKLVMPLPSRQERQQLARIFFNEIALSINKDVFSILKKLIPSNTQETVESLYVNPFVDISVGMTPGELYRLMSSVLIPVINDIVAKQKIITASDMITKFMKRDLSDRQSKVRELLKKAIALSELDIAEALRNAESEIKAKAIEMQAELEKYKTI